MTLTKIIEHTPFMFSGDHGDEPEPCQIMEWAQWDHKPLLVIRDAQDTYHAAIKIGETVDRGTAIRMARAQLDDWHGAKGDRDFERDETRELLQTVERAWMLDEGEKLNLLLTGLREIVAGY